MSSHAEQQVQPEGGPAPESAFTPLWLLHAEQEEAEALAALGLSTQTLAEPVDQVARDAVASRLLRAAAFTRREIAEREAARQREVEYINHVYQPAIERLERRAQFIENAVCALALESDFGSKKSRDVGFGTYGVRKTPARVEVEDEAAVVQDLSGFDAGRAALRATVTIAVDRAETQYPGLLQEARAKLVPDAAALKMLVIGAGMDVPGTRVLPEHAKPFAKPVLPADLGGVR